MSQKTSRLIISLMAASAMTVASATAPKAQQGVAGRPQIVVNIIVEGLDDGALDAYCPSLARRAGSGVKLANVDYGKARGVAATAMLMTGTTPSVNGIPSHVVYDRAKRLQMPVVKDSRYIGNFTDETYSPAPITVSTLADELAIAAEGRNHIYSISPNAAQAIVAGGHAASSAVWIADKDGRWATSTYYKDVPATVADRNYRRPLSARIDTMSWTPGALRYVFPRKDHNRYAMYKLTPRSGDDVTDLACDYIDLLRRTRQNTSAPAPDMLSLTYSVAEYPYGNASSSLHAEQADAYRRLDSQIERVIAAIDKSVGLDNALIVIAGVPAEPVGRSIDSRWNIPSGEFSPRRAKGLLNMYLMALHGNGEWVTGYADFQFYLNTDLARERKVDERTLRREAAEFLMRMSGVTQATSIDDLLMDPSRSPYIHLRTAGDVMIAVNPGWRLIETDDPSVEGFTIHSTASTAPAIILYPSIGSGKEITTTVSATTIAPTLARIIRIRAPNAAEASPLNF